MATVILTTKLYIPLPRPHLVSRSHLIERLETGICQGQRLTLISAPAGFGKTTLLSEWGNQTKLPLAWVSLDEEDNDPARFLAYLVAALQQISPHVGDGILSALQSPQPPPLGSILTSLINELVNISARGGFALILDDYHLIKAQPVHQALTFLLEHLPPQMHLIIASRIDPPLPLARLRTRNQLIEFRAADLRFTLVEAAMFLKRTMGLELSPEEVEALEARTEGWIAGLQLAALSMQGRAAKQMADFVAAFSGSHYHVIDYLAEEVLALQPEDIHDFLCQTSILERLTASLCDAVTGQKNSAAILRHLEQANLFLIPLDHERKWYRYHHLFTDFLRSHLQQDMPDQIPELHHRASQWYEQEELISAAISHALAAAAFKRAAALIERAIEPTMMRSEVATVQGWLDVLPDEVMMTQPLLCIYHALTLLYFGQPLEVVEARLQAALQADPDGDFAGECAVLKSFIAMLQGDAGRAGEFSQRALALLPPKSLFFRTLVLASLGASALMRGDISVAIRAFEETARGGQQVGNVLISVTAVSRLGSIAMMQGQYHQAKTFFEQALELAGDNQGRPRPVGGLPLMGLGWLLYEWNDLETAQRYLLEGIELVKKFSEIGSMPGYIGLALVKQAQGDLAGAERAVQTAWQLAEKLDATDIDDVVVAAYQVFLWIAQGNLEAAQSWVEERGLDQAINLREFEQRVDSNSLPYLQALEYITLARVYLALKRYKETLDLLALLLQRAEKAGWVWFMIESLTLQALIYHYQGDMGLAVTALGRALSLAEPGGFVRIFINEGPPMHILLRQLAAQGIAVDYVNKLLAVFSPEETENRPPFTSLELIEGDAPSTALRQAQDDSSGGAGEKSALPSPLPPYPSFDRLRTRPAPLLIDPLSERELEVLHLVEAGLSNREIASTLIVAPSTAKSHIKNIFRKLDVSSRTQALARARELKLL